MWKHLLKTPTGVMFAYKIPLQDQDLFLLMNGNCWRGLINTPACSPGAFIWHYYRLGTTTLQSISFGKNSPISKNCIATKNFCPKGKINNQIFPYKISILGFLHHLKNQIEGPIIWFISPISRRKIQSKAPVFSEWEGSWSLKAFVNCKIYPYASFWQKINWPNC